MKSISLFAGVVAVGSVAITLSASAGPLGGAAGFAGPGGAIGSNIGSNIGGSVGASPNWAPIGAGTNAAAAGQGSPGQHRATPKSPLDGNARGRRDGRANRDLRRRA